ncbi:hypothetical protein [Bacillus toyonensis]|uniref:hypothetical protein n=1 Tax=Bacillus toyonensis TaxID=155322 RepID=UPI003D1FD1DD
MDYIGYSYIDKGELLEIYAQEEGVKYLFIYKINQIDKRFHFDTVLKKENNVYTSLPNYPIPNEYKDYAQVLFERVRLHIVF